MISTFQSRQISFLTQSFLFAIVIFCSHSYLLFYFATYTVFFFPIWHIYLFNLLATVLLYTIVNYKYSKDKTTVFNTFMLSTLLKMVLVIVFLLPLLIGEIKDKKPDVFNFFITYFLFLIFEVYSIVKLLQNNVSK
ncbi:MAG TPA: hypothetical protein DCM02_13260 [Flavobacterium sp.]|nr:hypothetical protein [Flavobacterium sp.]HAT75597.1 hypothetical protein [Flavobacterium sp.]HAT80296.1 hypothetical protein [Flavobacterium sp.]